MSATLTDRFVDNATSNGTRIVRSDREELPGTVAEILRDEDGEDFVYSPDSGGLLEKTVNHGVLDAWTAVPPPPHGSVDRFAQAVTSAGVGLLCGDVGLAPHGTVAVRLTSSREGAVSLMPPATITVMDPRDLYRDSGELFRRFEADVREASASWILVTGPSSTADLGSLVQGVHGPSRSYVIVMETGDSR